MEENQDNGITPELINEILTNILTILNIKPPVEPTEPVNPTQEQQAQYEKELEIYEAELADYNHIIAVITLYIQAVCHNILIKTNRRMFVPELKYVVMNLVVDLYTNYNSMFGDDDIQSIQSMSEAGRSVNFGVSSVLATKLNLLAQKQLDENENLIDKYKLLYKT